MNTGIINIQYIENTCRICLKDKSKEAMKTVMSGYLHDLFSTFTNLELSEEDNLPYKLCMPCIERLKNSVAFREQCIKSDEILKQQKIIKTEKEDETTEIIQSGNETDASINHLVEVTYIEKLDGEDNELNDNVKKIQNKRNRRQHSVETVRSYERKKARVTIKEQANANLLDYNLCLSCPICGDDFIKADRLEAHYRVHLGKKPEVCTICNKEFSKACYLKLHMVSHNGKEPVCSQCGKRFATKFSLRVHERIHTGIRSFVCHVCGTSFRTNTHLKAHVAQKHSDDKPFACDKCPRAFKIPYALKDHMLRHSGIKKYVCTICGSATVTKGELDRHMAAAHSDEKPFACKSCPKRYKFAGELTIHSRSHTGERPYKCDLCPKTFRTGEVLKHHRMIHTGEKPHVCCICARAFTQQCALTTHMKIHKEQK